MAVCSVANIEAFSGSRRRILSNPFCIVIISLLTFWDRLLMHVKLEMAVKRLCVDDVVRRAAHAALYCCVGRSN